MAQRFTPARRTLIDSGIRCLLIEDASGQVLPKSNAENFPAHGNHHGPTAGVKIDFVYDLLSGTMVSRDPRSRQWTTTRAPHKAAKQNGKTACSKALARDGWHLILTNFTPLEASAHQLAEVYRARWAVEIQFRAWKQSLNLTKALNRKSSEDHLQALVLVAMSAHQLGMKVATFIAGDLGKPSLLSDEKLYDLLAQHFLQAKSFVELL